MVTDLLLMVIVKVINIEKLCQVICLWDTYLAGLHDQWSSIINLAYVLLARTLVYPKYPIEYVVKIFVFNYSTDYWHQHKKYLEADDIE